MTNTISNRDDVIDSSDILARIEELQGLRDDAQGYADEAESHDRDIEIDRMEDGTALSTDFSEEEYHELKVLVALSDEASGYSEDWQHGSTLIRETHFIEYCQELLNDLGELPKDLPAYIVIDWKETANNLRADYTTINFGGVEYLVR